MSHNDRRRVAESQRDSCRVPCFNSSLVRQLRAALPGDDALEEASALLGALADRSRLKILHALNGGEELCVCDVAHVLGCSVASASHHLRKLRDLRLVQFRNDGKMAYYSLRDAFAARLASSALGAAVGLAETRVPRRPVRLARGATAG